MNICLVSSVLVPAFRALGHEVLSLSPEGGPYHLAEELKAREFRPDFVLQQESLGTRVLLLGLEQVDCPKIFLSVDTHLNFFWHRHYARLFDLTLTTQPHLVDLFENENIPCAWLPWHGSRRGLVPHFERERAVGFVGRITPERPSRQWLAEHLQRAFGAEVRQDLPYNGMLDFYDRTRIAPNEAIIGEINFRLFEAASCGCALVTPRIHEREEELFASGSEVLRFSHGLELHDHLFYLARQPGEAERLGLAARARVLTAHLPVHRAQNVLDHAASLQASGNPTGGEIALELSGFELARAGRLAVHQTGLGQRLAALPQTSEVLRARIRLLAETGDIPGMREITSGLLRPDATPDVAEDTNLAGICSLACLRADDPKLAGLFLHRARGTDRFRPLSDRSDVNLLAAWSSVFARQGHVVRTGFPFDPGKHLPTTAAECLFTALGLEPGNLELVRRLEAVLDGERGTEPYHLGYLSTLHLHDTGNWRTGLRLGLANLRAFRIEHGLEELRTAREQSRAAGQEERFLRMLKQLEPEGVAAARLAAEFG